MVAPLTIAATVLAASMSVIPVEASYRAGILVLQSPKQYSWPPFLKKWLLTTPAVLVPCLCRYACSFSTNLLEILLITLVDIFQQVRDDLSKQQHEELLSRFGGRWFEWTVARACLVFTCTSKEVSDTLSNTVSPLSQRLRD